MSEYSVDGAELKRMVKLARKSPLPFAFNPGKSEAEHYFAMHRKRSASILGKDAKKEGPGAKVAFGSCTVENKVMKLTCERSVPAMARHLKRFLKANKVSLNVQILDAAGNVLEEDIEDLPDDPDLYDADDAATAQEASEPQATAAESAVGAAGEPAADAAAPALTAAGIVERLKAAQPRIAAAPAAAGDKLNAAIRAIVAQVKAQDLDSADAALTRVEAALTKLAGANGGAPPDPDPDGDPAAAEAPADPAQARWMAEHEQIGQRVAEAASAATADPSKLRAAWAMAVQKAGDGLFGEALTIADKVMAVVDQAGGDRHKAPDAADPNIAKWEIAKTRIGEAVTYVFSNNVGDVARVRDLWGRMMAFDEAGDYAGALGLVPEIAAVLKAANEEKRARDAEEKERKKQAKAEQDAADGAALLQELDGMQDRIAAALRADPDQTGEVGILQAAIRDAVSDSDLDLARVSMTRLEMLIGQGEQLLSRATSELADLAQAFEHATQAGTGDLDEIRAKFAYAQGKVENGEARAALTAIATVRDLIGAAGDAAGSQADAAAAQADANVAGRVDQLADADAVRAELTAARPRLEAIAALIPGRMDNAAALAETISSVAASGDVAGAKAALKQYLTIIAEGEAERKVVEGRRANLLRSLARAVAPEHANETETKAIEAERKIVTDALADDLPDTAAFGRATETLRKLDTLREQAGARIAALQAEVDKVIAERKTHDSDFDRLMGLPGDTADAGKLQRALGARDKRFDDQCKALDLDAAKASLVAIVGLIGDLKAEEAAIAKATAVREQFEREYAALTAQLKQARRIYEITPDFKSDVAAFQDADFLTSRRVKEKQFGRALIALDTLTTVSARLVARQGEFDGLLAAEERVDQKQRQLKKRYKKAKKTSLTTTEAKVARDALDAAEPCISDLVDEHRLVEAEAALDECIRLSNDLIAMKGACDALKVDRETARALFRAARDHSKPFRKTKAKDKLNPEFIACCDEIDAKIDAFLEEFNNTKDTARALAIAGELQALDAGIEALALQNTAAVENRKAMLAEYTKHKAKLDEALAIKPCTDEVLGLFRTFQADYQTLLDVNKTGNPGTDGADVVLAAVRSADALLAKTDENAAAAAAAEGALDTRLKAVKPTLVDASNKVQANAPDMDALRSELNSAWGKYQAAQKDGRFLEAIGYLDEAEAVCPRIDAAEPAAIQARSDRKDEYAGRYDSTFVGKLNAVLKFEDVTADMDARQKEIDDLSDEVEAAAGTDDYVLALSKLDALEPLVNDLFAFKATHDQLLADVQWLEAESAKIEADILTADAMGKVDRETDTRVTAYEAAQTGFEDAMAAYDFATARAVFPAFATSVADLVALKAQHDTANAAKQRVNTEWGKISADYDTANDMRPLTPELAKLVSALGVARARFDTAYFAHDYDAALPLVAPVEVAAKALLAKESDHTAAAAEADTKASEAEAALDGLSDPDLKSKTAQEKLDLLADLRGQKQKLTDKQRELQRKVYMAMELDEEFIKVDDERRDRLTEAIRGDEELMAARDNWDAVDDDQKVALLTRTLETECAIYGMPVPTVETFSEKPGDLGSFNSATNVIRINTHEDATFSYDFFDSIDTVVHENAHNYQDYLVLRLNEGLLQPGDPEYNQALIFAANDASYGYVQPKEDMKCYKKQPLEEHAWKTGTTVQRALRPPPKV